MTRPVDAVPLTAGPGDHDRAIMADHQLTRRELLSGTGRALLAGGLVGPVMLAACAVTGGEPWQDQTFWDDGTGWIE